MSASVSPTRVYEASEAVVIVLYTHFDIRDYPRTRITVERATEPDCERTLKAVLRADGTVRNGRGEEFASFDIWFAESMKDHRLTLIEGDVYLYHPPKPKIEKRND